ncbi:MAG TPA: hypothetical protein VGE07_03235 [Herpetosiphonaceae bacterium]
MHALKRLALLATIGLTLAAPGGTTQAASGADPAARPAPYPDSDKVARVERLKPAAGSDTVPLLELIHYRDQSVALHFQASGDSEPGQPLVEVSYAINVNRQTGEYQATKSELRLADAEPGAAPSAAHSIKIQAYDPVRALLHETLATYAWSWANGTITPRADHACGPKAPTAAGTNWFQTDCWRNEYLAPTRSEGSVQATGKYANSDWGFPGMWTYNHQWVYLSGRTGGGWVIDAWQRPSGEDSYLLSAKIIYQ